VAIQRTLNDKLGSEQALAIEIITMTERLQDKSIQTSIRWVSSHIEIKDNEKANILAKKVAKQPKSALVNEYNFFNYIQQLVRRQKTLETQQWIFNRQKQRLKHLNEFQEEPASVLATNKTIFLVTKKLSSRFFQLKIRHAIMATYLKRIQKAENAHY
jgi:hypothetical protein